MLKKNRILLTVMGLLGFVALILGLFVSQQVEVKNSRKIPEIHGTLLEQPRAIHDFNLKGIDHSSFTNANLRGQWTMMFFGFTNCGAICPTTMAELGKMYRILEEKGIVPLPQVVMVSVDPERDSLKKLGQYVQAFNPHFYGAKGDEESIKAMTQEMGIAYAKVSRPGDQDAEHYDIEHTGAIMLFNPEGHLSAFFTMPHKASVLANVYSLLANRP